MTESDNAGGLGRGDIKQMGIAKMSRWVKRDCKWGGGVIGQGTGRDCE